MNRAKKKPKPSEYPDIVLKALVREYDSNLNVRDNGMAESTLAAKPDIVLKALVREYDSNLNVRDNGMAESTLAAKADIVKDYEEEIIPNRKWSYGPFELEMHAAIRILEDAKYITAERPGSDNFIKPTNEGLDHARWLMHPGYRKTWDYVTGDVRTYCCCCYNSLTNYCAQLLGIATVRLETG